MKIAFLANYSSVDDGLGAALNILGERHEIVFFRPDEEMAIREFNPDRILHHGALTEEVCQAVSEYPFKKALCFGGGPVEESNVVPYDLYFVESAINEADFTRLHKRWMRAFGINDSIFYPMKTEKKYDACFAGSFSKWKRPELIAPLGEKLVAMGEFQDTEKECYEICLSSGARVRNISSREEVALAINSSHTVVNPADFWGGGQRLTLEAMACGVPPIVMSDSPKNREYVEESGFGLVVNPDTRSIEDAIESIKADPMTGGREYVMSKWSAQCYADKLEEGLMSL